MPNLAGDYGSANRLALSGDLSRRLRQSPDVVGRRMNQETVLIHLRTNQVFVLSPTAARFWELIGEDRSLGEIRQALLDEFDVTEAQLDREIDETLSQLIERKLLGDPDAV